MSRVDLLLGFARKLESLDPELAKECRAIMNTIIEEDMERARRLSEHRDPLVNVLRQLGNEVGIIKDDITRPGHARIGDWLCRPCDRWFGSQEVRVNAGIKLCPECLGPVEIKT